MWLQLTLECIQLQHSADGHPTGEAAVSFPTRADAERAIHDKNRHNMGSRYIELFLVWNRLACCTVSAAHGRHAHDFVIST